MMDSVAVEFNRLLAENAALREQLKEKDLYAQQSWIKSDFGSVGKIMVNAEYFLIPNLKVKSVLIVGQRDSGVWDQVYQHFDFQPRVSLIHLCENTK